MHTLEAIEFYTQFHPRWFESVQHYTPSTEYSDIYSKLIPSHWSLSRTGLWYSATPPNMLLTEQGWKLHISVTTTSSVEALTKVLPILSDESVPFKFIIDPTITALSNGKLWPRGSSGKFFTIYPNNLQQFYRLGQRLSEALDTFSGPYILSDRRWPGSKSVYYRYGGFTAQPELQIDGTQVNTILSPEGESIPDLRTPYWSPPPWVDDPFPEEVQGARSGMALNSGRFNITSALSFSNRGGVYRGIDVTTGIDVVIKEARPRVELGRNKFDAITMLKKEFRLLESLASTEYFVQPIVFFKEWEHTFLVEKFEPGESIGQYTIRHNPLYTGKITDESLRDYFEKMQSIWLQIANAIACAHERNIVLSDLSFTNVIINEGHIRIFDLETSIEQGVDDTVGLYTPGMATSGVSDQANDYYALGALMFGCVFLANGMVELYPFSLNRFLEELTDDVGLEYPLVILIRTLFEDPEQFVSSPNKLIESIKQLTFSKDHTAAQTPRLGVPIEQRFTSDRHETVRKLAKETVGGVVRYLNNTANTSRSDRLFPADLTVFETNPLSIAYGATGIIYALYQLTGQVHQRFLDWILQRTVDNSSYPPGLFLGQAGIAWVLYELGYMERAISIMHSARDHKNLEDDVNIMHGSAGYGLACLKLWVKGAGNEFLDEAVKIGEHLHNTSKDNQYGVYWPSKEGDVAQGYAYGGGGVALFLLYLSLATGNNIYFNLGRQALYFELNHGLWLDGEFLGFPGRITNPAKKEDDPTVLNCYWEVGSAGVGTTLTRYAAVTSDTEFQPWLNHLIKDASRKYTAFPQLFRGLAGLGNFLLDAWHHTKNEQHLFAAWEAAEGALLFRIERNEGIVFPGEQTRRECADLATGSAGVALFLDRLLKAQVGVQDSFLFVVDELLPSTNTHEGPRQLSVTNTHAAFGR